VWGPQGGPFADRRLRWLLMISAHVVSTLCMRVLIALFLIERIVLWYAYTMMAVRSAMQGTKTGLGSD